MPFLFLFLTYEPPLHKKALGLARNAGLDEDDAGLAPLLDVSTEEASGFLVEMDAGRVMTSILAPTPTKPH